MIANKAAIRIEYSEECGWGVVLEGEYGDGPTIFPKVANEAEAKVYMDGWNHCRRVIADAMLDSAFKNQDRLHLPISSSRD